MSVFRIRIDIEAVRRAMSTADRMEHDLDYVRQWLLKVGFTPAGDCWLVEEKNLGQLQPSEVLQIDEVSPP